MAIPKSKVLITSENNGREEQTQSAVLKTVGKSSETKLKIRPVGCCNDFVAVLQSEIDTFLALGSSEEKYRNEGIVVGIGPGISDGVGGRLKLTVNVGDYVMFGAKNIVTTIQPDNGPYAGKKVAILSERNIICKLPNPIQFEICGE